MKDRDEIKELFQKELGNYKVKVNPNLWNGIQAGISATGVTGATGAASAMALSTKIIIATSVAAVIAVGVTLYSISNDNNKTEATEQNELFVKEDTLEKETHPKEENVSEVINEVNSVEENDQGEESQNSDIIENEPQFEAEEINTSSTLTPQNSTTQNSTTQETKTEEINTLPIADNPPRVINQSSVDHSVITEIEDEVIKEDEIDLSNVAIKLEKENNQNIKFYAVKVPEGAEVIWDFGDGSFDYNIETQHYYFDSGEYNVSLKVQIDGQETNINERISVKIKGEIGELPNIFTPNGDGHNDEFFVETKHLKSFQLTVMDGHQNIVYSTRDTNFRWNGLDNQGRPVKDGNYIYVIMAEDEAGNTINKYQQLTIQR